MPDIVAIRDLGAHHGQTVTVRGWLAGRRNGGKIVFLTLRDGTGICQGVVEARQTEAFAAADALPRESSLVVTGTVRPDARATGGCELAVESLQILHAAADFPITPKPHGIEFLMEHRHLWLRSRRPTAILRIRHTVIQACRRFFDDRGFTLIDTPILSPGAGEDAQTLFPVDYFGETVFLTQTGQLYLESACLALGKVYCFGPTFRAEKSKTRRHLTEFWMIEPEVAFAELDDVIALAEGMVCACVEAVLAKHEADLALLGRDPAPLRRVQAPFPRLTYSAAAERLRSAETRRQLEGELARDRAQLQQWVDRGVALEQQLQQARKVWEQDKLQAELHVLREDIEDLERDVQNRPKHMDLAAAFEWGKDLGGSDETILSRQFDRPVFVTHYPAVAKAFYMKRDADDPRVVCNMDLLAPEGYGEIIGGSQREDRLDALEAAMREKGLTPEDYNWYLDLRRYGSVPHGGFGLGIERTLTWICGLKHVRETIPFPRTLGRIYP
ncbi:MAG: asparagine--tRNA ligase [Lentisphaerae bacterium]|nr:asparagine--tRNA ligase [Lentisphaerota bacterium]